MIYQDRRALVRIRNGILWLGSVTTTTTLLSLAPTDVVATGALGALFALLVLWVMTFVQVR